METLEELKHTIKDLEKKLQYSESQKKVYENGDAKLYYALQRKMSEMANTLNKQNLEDIDIDSKDSKSFDRIITILQKQKITYARNHKNIPYRYSNSK
jgi:hypothetical protein